MSRQDWRPDRTFIVSLLMLDSTEKGAGSALPALLQ